MYPKNFTFTGENTLAIIKIIEPLYYCSGMTKMNLYYYSLSLTQGPPFNICGEEIPADFSGAALPPAIIMILCAATIILLLPAKYLFLKEEKVREEAERQALLERKKRKETKKK